VLSKQQDLRLMGLAQAITFQEKQLDQNLYDVDYQQKEEFEWPRKQIVLFIYRA